MTEYFRLTKELVIENTGRGCHFGETYGMIKLINTVTHEVYGYIDYSLFCGNHTGNIFRINMIRVVDKYQRRGYATMMINYAKTHFKGYHIDLNTTTADGVNFFRASGIQIKKATNPLIPRSLLLSDKFK